ncbi:odorant receptor 43a-like [Condylostylus longicornis]|uniref:odorant receptor 43a-like n=1 Tax=Condylostylus longicornis TaxID=2530218 RepID=UPI00244DE998|nr:odorant receptor 43a-like [Condylostylus longicornis]
MFENIPILEINLKIFKFCGILFENNWKRYAIIIPVCLLNFLQSFFIYENRYNLTIFILHSFFFVAIFNAILRCFLLIVNRKKFEDFLIKLEFLHDNIMENGSKWVKIELYRITKNARSISIFNLSASFLDLIGAVLFPLICNDRIHPIGVGLPKVNIIEFPYYEIIYLLELTAPFLLTIMYMPFVNLFASVTMFGVIMLKDLQYQLRNLCNDKSLTNENNIKKKLINCIKYHNKIIRFVKEFNSMVTNIIFVEFLLYSVILCALLLCINFVESITQKISAFMYIFTMLYVLFTYYWQANELLDESVKVSFAIYDADWFNCSIKLKKMFSFIMMRSQRELKLMIGNTYPMSLETFQSLLNASYSYFTILRGVTNK